MPDSRVPIAAPSRPRPRGRTNKPSAATPSALLVVGIGASAGGLEACQTLVDTLKPGQGMAFILVQHLDPTHESMLVELLAGRTALAVRQATDGTTLLADHFYIIPPGTYLAVAGNVLRLSQPQPRHGARLPFDFLLHSMAESCGARAIAVVLSGSGSDGSLGVQAVHDKGGFVIAQDPSDAAFDGMPRSAIATGAVDLVVPADKVANALLRHHVHDGAADHPAQTGQAAEFLPQVIDLLRQNTPHDFRLYKLGTVQRRIARRMALAEIAPNATERYLALLRTDAKERDQLARDLLIHVTRFFRDTKVFELLASRILPDLVGKHPADQPLRLWVAGCSTGEETYSLVMLLHEAIKTAKRNLKLQIFASDVDPGAIATARDGLYPHSIEADVSAERLQRFFARDDHGYRVAPDVRADVVFAVQDVLADPPFSRLDLISCRNLLIYLRPEAQARIITLFHFALREGGLLLLGAAETVGPADGRFTPVAKTERVYRHTGRGRPSELGLMLGTDAMRAPVRPLPTAPVSRQEALAELCRRLVLERHGPASVLINQKHQCLYFLGPTERYLRVPGGQPTQDLLAMAAPGLRARLRGAVAQAWKSGARTTLPASLSEPQGTATRFSVDVDPVVHEGETLLLVSFIDAPAPPRAAATTGQRRNARVAELEQLLRATRAELHDCIRGLESSAEEQKAINEEALSVSEEYQSTNEELLTSKEELQSLNEELTALNAQLQETLERQRRTANDLQNVLFSTDMATLFLDTDLNIRFFTPATKALFNVIATDIGRPLSDLNSLAADSALIADARGVLRGESPIEREVGTASEVWFTRRVMPYRTHDNRVEGVVITFSDITERRRAAEALGAAVHQAELANKAKSRFLAATSHDLRQPLQTLALLQGLLARNVEGEKAKTLAARLGQTLDAMSGMLNTLLDINQIEAGTVRVRLVTFPVNDLLLRLREEFAYHAQAKGLDLRVVPCRLSIHSDPSLLEQMLRNLVANALKFTTTGRVLLGCRRHGGGISLEVWDTGPGIPEADFATIFDEYHQLDNAARERSRGLGLGLSIVQRLGVLLGHKVGVHSALGKGSVFSIEIPAQSGELPADPGPSAQVSPPAKAGHRTGTILVVEDDPDLRDVLELLLHEEGHHVVAAEDGPAALRAVAGGALHPDLIIADHALPGEMTGLQISERLHEVLGHAVPVIMLTGDISSDTLGAIAGAGHAAMHKPVRPQALAQAVQDRLASSEHTRRPTRPAGPHVEGRRAASLLVAALTARQHEIMERVLAGQPSKAIAADLGVSQRTVENHRAAIMRKTGAQSLPALVRLGLAAAADKAEDD